MFPLFQKELPNTAEKLAAALSTSLRRALDFSRDPVVTRGGTYPDIDEITVDLSGARMRMDTPRPTLANGKGEAAITAKHLSVQGHPISLGSAAIDLVLDATDIALHQTRDEEDNISLLLQRAETGRVAVSISQEDLERLVLEIAKGEAGRQGIVIEDVLFTLTSRGPRSLGAELRVQARKLFIRATIRITGKIEIDRDLVAHISGLNCVGEGTLGTLACGVLASHLEKLQARDFPLLALSLGEVRLHDILLDTSDGIKVTAAFGATPQAA